ncbi:hypothetical protein BKA82DRAFT_4012954 [Pisolithus tinctorius]|nr:hypothetical protein BKA82DRAFT_4012954 [Pisolithus tinctorius]
MDYNFYSEYDTPALSLTEAHSFQQLYPHNAIQSAENRQPASIFSLPEFASNGHYVHSGSGTLTGSHRPQQSMDGDGHTYLSSLGMFQEGEHYMDHQQHHQSHGNGTDWFNRSISSQNDQLRPHSVHQGQVLNLETQCYENEQWQTSASGHGQQNDHLMVQDCTYPNTMSNDPTTSPSPCIAPLKQKRTCNESMSLPEGGEGVKRMRKENQPLAQENGASTNKKLVKPMKQQCKAKQKANGDKAMEQFEWMQEKDRNWTDVDTTLLLEALLGSESTYFNTLIVNAKRAYKKVASEVFGDQQHTAESVRGHYERLRKIFSYILNYESITGNGGGDPDDVGNLSGTILKKFYGLGWYELFNDRGTKQRTGLGNIQASHEKSNDEDDSDFEVKIQANPSASCKFEKPTSRKPTSTMTPPASKGKVAVQKGITAPRHRCQTSHGGFSTEAAEFFSSNVEYLRSTMESEKERLILLQQKEAQEEKQHDLLMAKGIAEVRQAETNAKVRHAQEVMLMEGMPEEVKAHAREVLLNYFSINHFPEPLICLPSRKCCSSSLNVISLSIATQIHIINITIVDLSITVFKERNELWMITQVYAQVVQSNQRLHCSIGIAYVLLWRHVLQAWKPALQKAKGMLDCDAL